MTDSDDTHSFEDMQEEVTGDKSDSSNPREPNDSFSETYDRKHTTGAIDGYEFTLRLDGDAPDALMAEIEAALANVKADYNDTQAGDGDT